MGDAINHWYFLKESTDNTNHDTLTSKGHLKHFKSDNSIAYKLISWNLISNFLTAFLYYGVDIIKYHYIGQLKDLVVLDALGLGFLFYGTALFFGNGMTEGMSSECSKCFGNKKLVANGKASEPNKSNDDIFLLDLRFYKLVL